MSFPVLTRTDLCDARNCNAVALVVAMFDSGKYLIFCNHHTNEYLDGLNDSNAWLDYQK